MTVNSLLIKDSDSVEGQLFYHNILFILKLNVH